MRVAIVDTYYVPFLESLYRKEPGLTASSYEQQLRFLLECQMGTGDAYSHYLREQGHEAVELVANAPALQSAWARERRARATRLAAGLPGRVARQLVLHSVLGAQIRALDPDVVYLQDLRFLTRAELEALRRAGRLVVGQIASAPPREQVLRGYDLILTSFPHFVARFRALGIDTEYLPIAFDERVRDRLAAAGIDTAPSADRPIEVAFVGGLTGEHGQGTVLLERLAGRLPLSVWGYGVDSLAPGSALRACHRGEAWGMDMYRILARSQIVINRHIDVAQGYSNNMRLYEATGAGALLLTERSPNLAELFDPGTEILAYEDEDELITLAERHLSHPADRVRIATAGQARTLSDHTYRVRIAQLAEMLEQRLSRR